MTDTEFNQFCIEFGFVPAKVNIDNGNTIIVEAENRWVNRKGDIILRTRKTGNVRYIKYKHDKDGYNRLAFPIGVGIPLMRFVHKIVALTFIPNADPSIYTEVNHKNLNKSDNRVENLEWVTSLYNHRHYLANKHYAKPEPDYPLVQLTETENENVYHIVGKYNSLRCVPRIDPFTGESFNRTWVRHVCNLEHGTTHRYRKYLWWFQKDLPKEFTLIDDTVNYY